MDAIGIGTISSVIAAVAGVATLWFSVRNSKGNILKRIDKKQAQIRAIEDQQVRMYGINGRFPRTITPLDEKKEKLQREISELTRKL